MNESISGGQNSSWGSFQVYSDWAIVKDVARVTHGGCPAQERALPVPGSALSPPTCTPWELAGDFAFLKNPAGSKFVKSDPIFNTALARLGLNGQTYRIITWSP